MKYGIPSGYSSKLDRIETIDAINSIHMNFSNKLIKELDLIKIRSSIVTDSDLWLNDDFRSTERPLDFDVESKVYGELLLSNSKWRRYQLYLLSNNLEKQGIITDISTVRRDLKISNTTSVVYNEIGIEILKNKIDEKDPGKILLELYKIILSIDSDISKKYPELESNHFDNSVSFVTLKNLKKLYPLLNSSERLNKFGRENGSFILTNFAKGLDVELSNFSEDVYNLETYCSLYIYNRTIEKSISIAYSSFQIDKESMVKQNINFRENSNHKNKYNRLLFNNELPLTISMGISIDRIMMAILEKYHIAEVASGVWEEGFVEFCESNKIDIF